MIDRDHKYCLVAAVDKFVEGVAAAETGDAANAASGDADAASGDAVAEPQDDDALLLSAKATVGVRSSL